MAETRPLPARATLLYLVEKYRHETQFENYMMDMLWAPANGMQFKAAKRYNELTVNFSAKEDTKSGEEIVENMIARLEGGDEL